MTSTIWSWASTRSPRAGVRAMGEPSPSGARPEHAWFAGLAVEAACSDPLRGVITVVDRDDRQLFHLTAVGADHTATLQPGVVSPWLD